MAKKFNFPIIITFFIIFFLTIITQYSKENKKLVAHKGTALEFKINEINFEENLFQLNQCEYISREDFLSNINKDLKALEIGPLVFPSLIGKNVKYFDVLDKKGLINLAKRDKLDTSRSVDIDYVSSTADLKIIKEKFDIVFSSHNIEHQIDLAKHMSDVYELLNYGGQYYMFIPDKRYCFDHHIPMSSMSDVLYAHYLPKDRHSLKTILTKCETTHNNPAQHWKGEHGESLFSDNRLSCYKNNLQMYFESKDYIDSHQWRFTPENFVYIFNSLYRLGLINFKLEKVYCTKENVHEFSAIFKK